MMSLNKLQQKAYDYVKDGVNIGITGVAGSGKSFLIKKIYKDFSSSRQIAITSTTGVSAHNIGGKTVHSFLGIGLGTGTTEELYKKISKSKKLLSKWVRLDILIIDEISMLNMELFEKLEKLARLLRNNTRVFGGIQLIFSYDFLQLPPVLNDYFCFESSKWDKCITKTVYLTEIMRQKDQVFGRVLNKIRLGSIDDEVRSIIKSREIEITDKNGIIPTMLFSTNVNVDMCNKLYYDKLPGQEYKYKIRNEWLVNPKDKMFYLNQVKFQDEVNLKVGVQVMYLINKNGLFNGSRGIVKGFVEGNPKVLFIDGIERVITPEALDIVEGDIKILSSLQIPLKLAYSISIHKSQSMTIDFLQVDLKNVFEYSQFYVALSRVRNLEGLFLKNLDFNLIYTSPKALQYYKKLNLKNEKDL